MNRAAAVVLLLLLFAGCATTPLGRADLLAFIEDGRTSREEAYLQLGEPSAFFEGGRILSFRLGQDDGGYFLVEKAKGFVDVRFSLMMVFDDRGVLQRHSLVRVKGH